MVFVLPVVLTLLVLATILMDVMGAVGVAELTAVLMHAADAIGSVVNKRC